MKNGETIQIWPLHAGVPVSPTGGAVFLPLDGRAVAWSAWWAQRLRDGDITTTDPTPPPPAPAPAPASAPKASASKKDA